MPPRILPGNPKWIEWIRTLELAAEEKGSRAASAYAKARRSFERCPIEFNHPDEALALEGVGKKTVEILLIKITEECSRAGIPPPERPVATRKAPSKSVVRDAMNGNAVAGPSRKRPAAAAAENNADLAEDDLREARRRRLLGLPPESPTSRAKSRMQDDDVGFGDPGSGSASAPAPAAAPAKKRAAPTAGKAYVPKKGSGAYAILIALYRNGSYEDPQVWTTRAKITELGQDYADQPFDKPSVARNGGNEIGAGFYSAWSGMTTLASKDLVLNDKKRPLKYSLTEEGYALADSLAVAAGIPQHAKGPSSGGNEPVPWNAPLRAHTGQLGSSSGGGGSFTSGSGCYRLGAAPAGLAPSVPGRYPNARKRQRTPSLLEVGDDEGVRSEEEDDPEFAEQMRRARALSRQESHPSSSSSNGRSMPLPLPLPLARPRQAPARDYSLTSGAVLDGRRAASGHYAANASSSAGAPTPGNIDLPFGYYYLDTSDNRVINQDLAEVGQEDGSFASMYRIEYRLAQSLHQMTKSVLRSTQMFRMEPLPGGQTMTGYLRGRVANLIAPGFPSANASNRSTSSSTARRDIDEFDLLAGYKEPPPRKNKDAMYEPPVPIRRLGSDPSARPPSAPNASTSRPSASSNPRGKDTSIARTSSVPNRSSYALDPRNPPPGAGPSVPRFTSHPTPLQRSSSSDSLPSLPKGLSTIRPFAAPSRAPGRPLARTTSTQNPLLASFDQVPNQVINRHPLDPVKDHVSSTPYVHIPFRANILLAGTFKVLLIVDTRELGTSSRNKRTEMVDCLEKENVPVDRKMLPIGDMIWVARPVDDYGVPTGQDDVVLDAIVERKRLDDLCSSIRDGRYVNQKIRLKDSAISQRIYLIEKYDDKSRYAEYGKAIWTCKSQLQVNDGFYVHESGSFKDTITFLKMRTQIMREQYESHDLLVIPDASIDRPTYLSMQRHLQTTSPAQRYLTSYQAFDQLNKNDSALNLRTQWARMLSCMSGLSAEKTVQFVARWSTPKQFFAEGSAWAEIVKEDPFVVIEGKPPPKKARKAEDFVIEHLPDIGTRGIKGKLGTKLWNLFQTPGKYQD